MKVEVGMITETKPKPLPCRVTLKNVKEAGGEETPRFEASLYLDGKRVATVSNGGTGGCNSYHWADGRWDTPNQKVCNQIAEDYLGETYREALDMLVYSIMDSVDYLKKAKSNAKKGFPITICFDSNHRKCLSGFIDRKAMLASLAKQGVTTYELIYEASEAETVANLREVNRKHYARQGVHFLYEAVDATGQTVFLGTRLPLTAERIATECATRAYRSMVAV